jgi:hypothetical protein
MAAAEVDAAAAGPMLLLRAPPASRLPICRQQRHCIPRPCMHEPPIATGALDWLADGLEAGCGLRDPVCGLPGIWSPT